MLNYLAFLKYKTAIGSLVKFPNFPLRFFKLLKKFHYFRTTCLEIRNLFRRFCFSKRNESKLEGKKSCCMYGERNVNVTCHNDVINDAMISWTRLRTHTPIVASGFTALDKNNVHFEGENDLLCRVRHEEQIISHMKRIPQRGTGV